MKIHEKLQHLSEEQMEELFNDYENMELRIADIIEKFSIDVKPNGLLKILPPIKVTEKCRYCDESLFKDRNARNSSYHVDKKELYCLQCGHREYPNWRRYVECSCSGCLDEKRKKAEEKIKVIEEYYGVKYDKINFLYLSLEEKIKLVYVLLNNPNKNVTEVAPISYSTDSLEMERWLEIIDSLVLSGILSISSRNIEAFLEEDFPAKVNLCKAAFNVQVYFDEETIDAINNRTYFSSLDADIEKVEIWKELIYRDAINRFEEMMNERGLELYISENANIKFKELIEKISYTQLIRLCFNVARFFSDKVIIKDMNRSVANKAALINVSKFYERSREQGYDLWHSDYELVGDELAQFVELILGKDLEILKRVASVESLKNGKDFKERAISRIKRFNKEMK